MYFERMIFMLKRLIDKDSVTVVVHGGSFHGDDVACVALLKVVHDNVNVIRKFKVDPETETADYILDIGNVDKVTNAQVFLDHHQGPELIPGTEIKHCAFSKLALRMIDNSSHRLFRKYLLEELILPIAAQDNGQNYSEYGLVPSPLTFVNSMKLNWTRDQSFADSRFDLAASMASSIIEIIIDNVEAKVKAYDLVNTAIQKVDGGVMKLDRYLPWTETVIEYNEDLPKIQIVAYPNNRGGFSIQVVPKKIGSFDSWIRISESVTSFEGCTGQAHGAYAFFDSLEHAVTAGKKLVKKASTGL